MSDSNADPSLGPTPSEMVGPIIHDEGLTSTELQVLEELSHTDWTFSDAATSPHVHGIHPYPAKFIPQIPRRLIATLHPGDSSATLDPFCGSGTALLESILQGIPAIGIDVNPLAALVSKVKTTPIDEHLGDIVRDIVESTEGRLTGELEHELPDIPRLEHWFEPEVSRAVEVLRQEIAEKTVDGDIRDVLQVALSSILVKVSNQESNVRYAAIEKDVDQKDVLRLFREQADDISRKLTRLYQPPLFNEMDVAEAEIVHMDVRDLRSNSPDWNVGLIVTSPPYPNAYEYWLYHKYRMYWLGMDPIAAREDEIGARAHYSRKNGLNAEDFASDMEQAFRSFRELLSFGCYACFLIRRTSTIRGDKIDNVRILREVAEACGFRTRALLPRSRPATRTGFNPEFGSEPDEVLVIFRREE